MKVVASKIKFYGIFLWRKTKSPPELIGNLVSKALLLLYDLTGGSRVIIMITADSNDGDWLSSPLLENKNMDWCAF